MSLIDHAESLRKTESSRQSNLGFGATESGEGELDELPLRQAANQPKGSVRRALTIRGETKEGR